MKTMLKRCTAVFLAVLMTAVVLTSCSADTSAPVMKYELTEVTEKMYTYWTSVYKSYYLQLLGGEEPVGRQLDFLLQEFNREANTIASKAGSLSVTQEALNLKKEIEKVREQIQNLE